MDFAPEIILLIGNNKKKLKKYFAMLEMVIFKDHLTGALLAAYPEISPFSAAGSK